MPQSTKSITGQSQLWFSNHSCLLPEDNMHVKEANSLPATRFPLRAWPCPQVPREIHLDTTATASYSGIFVRSVVLFPAATGYTLQILTFRTDAACGLYFTGPFPPKMERPLWSYGPGDSDVFSTVQQYQPVQSDLAAIAIICRDISTALGKK